MEGNAPLTASVDTSVSTNNITSEWNPTPTAPTTVPWLDTIAKAVEQYNETNSLKNAPFVDESDTWRAKQEEAARAEQDRIAEEENKAKELDSEQQAKFDAFVWELASYNQEYADAVTSWRITPDEAIRIVEIESELAKKYEDTPEDKQVDQTKNEEYQKLASDYSTLLQKNQSAEYDLWITKQSLEIANRKIAELTTRVAQHETDDTKIVPNSQEIYKLNETIRQLNEAKDFASLSKFLWQVNSFITNNTKYWSYVNGLDLSETFAWFINALQNGTPQQAKARPSTFDDQNFL